MEYQINEITLKVTMEGEPCDMTLDQMSQWFVDFIESKLSECEGEHSVDVVDSERWTRRIGPNEI